MLGYLVNKGLPLLALSISRACSKVRTVAECPSSILPIPPSKSCLVIQVLPAFESLLQYFEALQREAVRGDFDERIQQSITLAWNKAQEYYVKTDLSVAWQASLVLHPRWKWVYFEEKWTGAERVYVVNGKRALKQLWEKEYKSEPQIRQETVSPEPEPQIDYLEAVLNSLAPAGGRNAPIRTSSRRDQLVQYLEEPTSNTPPFEYWKSRQAQWPQLAAMVFDFLADPAMSYESTGIKTIEGKEFFAKNDVILSGGLFDRSERYSFEKFDIRKELERFVKVLAGYAIMSDAELDLNTLIKRDGNDKYIVTQDVRISLEEKPIASTEAIVCRGTTTSITTSFDGVFCSR
ncbi:hypothetical protein IFR05_002035 [Cadophora sp. M221]|nr:hypothetical protein IFR05_002035 [Cadophora sp. M221]